MINLYIDESGSITEVIKVNSSFIISIIKVKDSATLKKNYKRFVSKNLEKLKKIDNTNKMFDSNGKFLELKGSSLKRELKLDFVNSITKNSPFELYYIHLYNNDLNEAFFSDKSRSFNYLLKLFIINQIHKKNFPKDKYRLQIDERNVKTKCRYELEGYLNTELLLPTFHKEEPLLDEPIEVQYYDSCNNKFIQIADVFSNLYYSHIITNQYNEIFIELKKNKILKDIFIFPLKSKNSKK